MVPADDDDGGGGELNSISKRRRMDGIKEKGRERIKREEAQISRWQSTFWHGRQPVFLCVCLPLCLAKRRGETRGL